MEKIYWSVCGMKKHETFSTSELPFTATTSAKWEKHSFKIEQHRPVN